VEALTRVHHCDLLITKEVQDGLDQRLLLEEMPVMEIKGKDEPLLTYFVKGLKVN
jgi:hypothetical protein